MPHNSLSFRLPRRQSCGQCPVRHPRPVKITRPRVRTDTGPADGHSPEASRLGSALSLIASPISSPSEEDPAPRKDDRHGE